MDSQEGNNRKYASIMPSLKLKITSLHIKRITWKIQPSQMTLVPAFITLALMSSLCISLSDAGFQLVSYLSLAIILASLIAILPLQLRNGYITMYGALNLAAMTMLIGMTIVNVQDIKNCIYHACTIFLYLLLLCYYTKRFKFILVCFALALSFCIYINFFHMLVHPELWFMGKSVSKEAGGYLLGGSYNQMGIRMVVAIGINLLCTHYSRKWLFNIIPLIIICIISLALVGSMTSLSGIIILAILCTIPSIRLQKVGIFALFIIFLLFQIFVVFSGKGLESNELAVYIVEDVLHKDITFTHRTDMWDSAIRVITESPIWGYGYVDGVWFKSNMSSFALGPHNMILAFLIFGGTILLALYIAILYKAFKSIAPYINERSTLLLLAAMITSWFMALMEMYPFTIMFLMPAVAYYYGRSRKESDKIKEKG